MEDMISIYDSELNSRRLIPLKEWLDEWKIRWYDSRCKKVVVTTNREYLEYSSAEGKRLYELSEYQIREKHGY